MRRFSHSELEFISDMATAVKWSIEILMENGTPFDQAKAARIKEAEVAWKGLTPDMQQAVRSVAWSISPGDLSKRTHLALKDQLRQAIEKDRGKPLGWVERAFFNATGMTW